MRSRNNEHRLWRVWASILALVMLLTGSLVTQAQQSTPTGAYTTFLPLVIGGAGTAPVSAVRFIADSQRAAHAAIGPEGGTLSAEAADGTRFELLIAPEALDFTETITMTPVLRAENLPLSGGLLGAVSLEPAGLDFYAPAVLRILSPTPASDLLTIGFAYDGDGAQFHLRPIAQPIEGAQPQVAEPLVNAMELTALRPVGMARGTQADIRRQLAQPAPADPQDAMEQQLLLAEKLYAELQLNADYQTLVRPTLQHAATDDRQTDAAIRRFDRWLFWVDKFGLRPRFITEFTEGKNLIGKIIPRASAAAAERCFSQKRPEEGFRLLRWMRYARKYLDSAQVAAIEAKLAKCLRFELTFHSHMTEGGFGDPYGYLYDLRAKVVLRAGTGMHATGAGPLEWQEVVWIGRKSVCTISVAGTGSIFDAQSLGLGLSITPVSRTSPAVNITLRYNPGTPGEQTSIQCPGGGHVASTQAWATYYGQTHAHERDGADYRVTAQIVGAGSFSGWNYPHLTTSGPSGQAVIEATDILLVHAPER